MPVKVSDSSSVDRMELFLFSFSFSFIWKDISTCRENEWDIHTINIRSYFTRNLKEEERKRKRMKTTYAADDRKRENFKGKKSIALYENQMFHKLQISGRICWVSNLLCFRTESVVWKLDDWIENEHFASSDNAHKLHISHFQSYQHILFSSRCRYWIYNAAAASGSTAIGKCHVLLQTK